MFHILLDTKRESLLLADHDHCPWEEMAPGIKNICVNTLTKFSSGQEIFLYL